MTRNPIAHHIKGIGPALNAMQTLGFSPEQCFAGSGLEPETLSAPGQQITLLQQEQFYRHLLQLSGNPLLGLELGRAYRLEHYGMFGYAMLSTNNLRECAELGSRFSALAFSLFRIRFIEQEGWARLQFHPLHPIAPDLLAFHCDRDLMACWQGVSTALGKTIPLHSISLMHDQHSARKTYEQRFGCPVGFDAPWAELCFESSLLDTPMPCPDPETSQYFLTQCQRMIAQLSRQSPFIDRVRQTLMETPGHFPDIEVVAQRLNTSVRTLRRRLAEQETSFRRLLDEIRYQLARDYLKGGLRVAEVAALLDYSETANFTHAFKRWSNTTPSDFQHKNTQPTADQAPPP
ncbi:AraC family transcriptional regulator [Aestuariirhabdus sp. Z084]|uniref:AraC family transcriptional regulator n=1 Tax=Aestuariirhabdus haliotis TaxID=2918751 RepID=UPI00201B4040|nr:AraC family transcriptional regulator [Aestuariirhabdus haliotis]MCL6416426.1 AraC family transcriptional regulator [Aestuariirhabdus haliotis]MCL6420408.1 AraC family transcriptional regulator [Aestuariirhabdus haliotis]